VKFRAVWTGVEEALQNIARVPVVARQAAPSALSGAATAVAVAARSIAPEESGDLRDGIEVHEAANGAEVESTEPHSIHVEYGTTEQAAQPFLRPAMDRMGKPALAAAAKRVKQAVGA